MEKYAVETTKEDNIKQASEKTCPSCGKRMSGNSNVPCCNSCGTKPFEPKYRNE